MTGLSRHGESVSVFETLPMKVKMWLREALIFVGGRDDLIPFFLLHTNS